MEKLIRDHCPYCDAAFEKKAPDKAGPPREVLSLPYTRDIGRFDGGDWSIIGDDYLSYLNWERIGILREADGVRVAYSVHHCPACSHPFDLYVNYSPVKCFSDIWPHLLGRDDQGRIRAYSGASWLVTVVRWLSRLLGSDLLGTSAVGLVFLLVALFPWFLPHSPQNLAALFSGSGGELVRLSPELSMRLAVYGVGFVGLIGILYLQERFVRFLQTTKAFEPLLDVRSPDGLAYWRNFTLCRFVGVQAGKIPSPTQVDIVIGGLAVATLLAFWIGSRWGALAVVLLAVWVLLAAGAILLNPYGTTLKVKTYLKYASLGILLAAISVGLLLLLLEPPVERWQWIKEIADLVAFLFLAYLLGTGAHLALNVMTYVLKGIQRIPMKLSYVDNFNNLHPVRFIQRLSILSITVVFVLAIGLISVFLAFSQPAQELITTVSWSAELPAGALHPADLGERPLVEVEFGWVKTWLIWVMAVLFAALAISFQVRFILLTAVYILLEANLPIDNITIQLFGTMWFQFNWQLFNMGLFFTFLLTYHFVSTSRLITQLAEQARSKFLVDIDRQLNDTLQLLEQLRGSPSLARSSKVVEQYAFALQSYNALFALKDRIYGVKLRSGFLTANLISPLLWSIILPSLWSDFIMERLLHQAG